MEIQEKVLCQTGQQNPILPEDWPVSGTGKKTPHILNMVRLRQQIHNVPGLLIRFALVLFLF